MPYAPAHRLWPCMQSPIDQVASTRQSSPRIAVCLTPGDHRWTTATASAVRHLLGAFISAASTADSTCAMLAAKALLPHPEAPPAKPWRVQSVQCARICTELLPAMC